MVGIGTEILRKKSLLMENRSIIILEVICLEKQKQEWGYLLLKR